MTTDDAEFWSTTSAFVASTGRETYAASAGGGGGGHVVSTSGSTAVRDVVIAAMDGRRIDADGKYFVNATASPLHAADDATWRLTETSTSGGDDDDMVSGLLWLPYVVFTVVLFSLIALSFVRFHCQRGHQYRRRQAEMGDKRPYRQLQQPTPDHLRLLGSETGSAGGYHPNGGPSSSAAGGYLTEQMNLFVQYSQVVPDEYDESGTSARAGRKNGSGNSKRGGLNRRPLVFTFNSNGSMVDVRCDEEERTNTFRLVPNADSAGGDEPEIQEIDLGNGDLDDLEPSSVTVTQLSSANRHSVCNNRTGPTAHYTPGLAIPPPPSSSAVSGGSRTSAPRGNTVPVSGDRPALGTRYARSSNNGTPPTSTTTAQSHHQPYADQNHLGPPSSTELTATATDVPDGDVRHANRSPSGRPSCRSPPPRPSTSSSMSTHKPPLDTQTRSPIHQRRHQQQNAWSSSPSTHQHRPVQSHHQHRLNSSAAAPNLRPNHHGGGGGGGHGHHQRTGGHHRHGGHYAPIDGSDRNRKDLYGSDEEEPGLSCAAEALLLWQKRV